VDAFGFADPEAAALQPMVERLARLVGDVREDLLAPPGLSVWGRAQRTLQPWEAWLTFREWIDRVNPRLAFGVARGLILGSMIPESERGGAELMRREARARMAHLLTPGTILCLPTTPCGASPRGQALSALGPVRDRILLPVRPRRPHRGAAGEPARSHRRRSADRAVDRRGPGHRLDAGRGGPGGGRRAMTEVTPSIADWLQGWSATSASR